VSYGFVFLVVAAVWLAIGLRLPVLMGRRGHDAFSWLAPGALATVIPYDSGFDHQRTARAALEQPGEPLGGAPRLELLHGRPAAGEP
jgi:hypothetical protein